MLTDQQGLAVSIMLAGFSADGFLTGTWAGCRAVMVYAVLCDSHSSAPGYRDA
jgi:hypothetical protein